ncbi:hypothetical protein D3C76_405060 [compost metagenome]
MDLSKEGAPSELYQKCRLLKVDIKLLVNNAGFATHGCLNRRISTTSLRSLRRKERHTRKSRRGCTSRVEGRESVCRSGCTELSMGAVIASHYTKAKSSACWKHASSA